MKPMTQLDAVNFILKNMGETPVNRLSGELPIEASEALDTLLSESREVQIRGWFFNTETHDLYPSTSGDIHVPKNAINVKAVGKSYGLKLTIRDGRLYNMTPKQHGFTFSSPIELRIIFALDFENLPESAKSYITHRSARIFQVDGVGDSMSAQDDSREEARSLARLESEQLMAEPKTLRDRQSFQEHVSYNLYSQTRL